MSIMNFSFIVLKLRQIQRTPSELNLAANWSTSVERRLNCRYGIQLDRSDSGDASETPRVFSSFRGCCLYFYIYDFCLAF